ncbi:MAG: response regulator [Holosporaceae bacterium]|jgi:DNA-binding response OmpR family regulator|nr:response regulator [Holosporaceae bacterium]
MQTSLFKKSAVLIEKNPLHCMLYQDVLDANGFDVYAAKSAMDGLIKIKETQQDLVVINTEIAEESFVEKLISKIKAERSSNFMPIVGLSVYDSECKKNIANALDIFLTKPISIDKLVQSIFAYIESRVNGS